MSKTSKRHENRSDDVSVESSAPSLLAYFSHSYRAEEKDINLRIWEIFSEFHLHFTVDPRREQWAPMDITELELMMQRSACFISVIPQRPNPPLFCSPYQLFEHGLAIRANKPRLLFVERNLPRKEFAPNVTAIIPYESRLAWFDENEALIKDAARKLVGHARQTAPTSASLRDPAGVIVGSEQPYDQASKIIVNVLARYGFGAPTIINPQSFKNEQHLLNELQGCSVLVSEIRAQHVPPDLLGLLHGTAIPTMRLCHVGGNEKPEALQRLMGLTAGAMGCPDVLAARRKKLPVIFSGYRVDEAMQPIIFWSSSKELGDALAARLDRFIQKDQRQLDRIDNMDKARAYFLGLGRVQGKVFLSNAGEINDKLKKLKRIFRNQGIAYFHYRDPEEQRTGIADYRLSIEEAIEACPLFVALFTGEYEKSDECRRELQKALDLYRKGALLILPYSMARGTPVPVSLGRMNVTDLASESVPQQLKRIITDAINSLELNKRLQLTRAEHTALRSAIADLGSDPKRLREHLKRAGASAGLLAAVDQQDLDSEHLLVDRLLEGARHSLADANALGRLIYRLTSYTSDHGRRRVLTRLVVQHRLLPDVQAFVGAPAGYEEIGIGYFHNGAFTSFAGIGERRQMNSVEVSGSPLEEGLIQQLVSISAGSTNWDRTVTELGKALGKQEASALAQKKINELVRTRAVGNEQIGICICGDETSLRIPLEWTIPEGQRMPLYLRHPVRRFLVGVGETPPGLRQALLDEFAAPLRILLVAANTGRIPEADREIEMLAHRFRSWVDALGWPADQSLCILTTAEATPRRVEQEIRYGNYDMLHFAGHGGFQDTEPGILLSEGRPSSQNAFVSARKLKDWIGGSSVRFVYLGCCHSAGVYGDAPGLSLIRFDSLIQAVVLARVPEVVGFLWPIGDRDACEFAVCFYEHYLKSMRAVASMHSTRQSFEHNRQIVAGSVLYSQLDSEFV